MNNKKRLVYLAAGTRHSVAEDEWFLDGLGNFDFGLNVKCISLILTIKSDVAIIALSRNQIKRNKTGYTVIEINPIACGFFIIYLERKIGKN